MKVLSLFDGMSCLQVTLQKMGITPEKVYAAEIDKFAIKEVQANFPDTTQLGSVTEWRDWDIDWAEIDLVTGGFPCQAWSMAGKQLGDRDERGMLFWTMLDIMKHVRYHNPNADFFIENVKMKKEFEEYITTHTENALGHVHKIMVNAALVSAQNRQRYYWTSWRCEQPEGRGIVLGDILENPPTDPTYMSDKFCTRNAHILRDDFSGKAKNLSAMEYVKNGRQGDYIRCQQVATATDIKGLDSLKRVYSPEGKAPTLTTMQGGHRQPKVSIDAPTFEEWIRDTRSHGGTRREYDEIYRPAVRLRDKSKTVRASGRNSYDRHEWDSVSDCHYRKLTVIECARLQGVPDDYFKVSSKSQAYKMLGNGWQCDVIEHLFRQNPGIIQHAN